ncbi:MAG: glycosyltransferase [Acidobacteriota bacterium]|nr:glycosyltransferase [Acidobacteriota bacterium]
MKKNVLQFIGSFRQGGSERQAVQLARLLHDDGNFRVFVACLDAAGSLRQEIEKLGINEIPEFKLKSFYDANFLRQINLCAKFIKRNEISIVHTHDFYTNIFGMLAASLACVPVRIASKRETLSKTKKQLLIERQVFRSCDKILANAEAVKRFLIESGVSAEKIVTIYNGLDLARLTPAPNLKREEILRQFGLPYAEKIKFITIVANLRSDVKNHRMFLQAAKEVEENFRNVAFVLAGEGELTESLKTLAKDLRIEKDTYFIGRCAQVAELLFISDVCVLSSKSEGFSNSILEYMSAAKPVVATDVGGASEAIINNQTGFLVESGDDEAMANRLIELLQNPELAKQFGNSGRERVEKHFSPAAQLAKTSELYDKLLSEKARR